MNKTICFALALILQTISLPAWADVPAADQHLSALSDDDFHDDGAPATAKVALGQALMFDKLLSGNRNISCATCHHPLTGTGDGLSLPIGEGGRGLGTARNTGSAEEAVTGRVPRNAPPLFNLGAREFTVLFHDGRLAADTSQPGGFASPAGDDLPPGLENVLAAQAMFPVTSADEMAGQPGENSVADAAAAGNLAGPGGVWEQLAQRLRNVPAYVALFKQAYAGINQTSDITFVHAANAISAFERVAWRADNSPFDRFLRGERGAISRNARLGMRLFYDGTGSGMSCGSCHSGRLQTDHEFHAIAIPQIGPGKGDGYDGLDDFGRERVTGNAADRYRFRTPTLRNVALTAPYGHSGAFNSLETIVEHHIDSIDSLRTYDPAQAFLPSRPDLDAVDFTIMNDASRVADIEAANELPPMGYSPRQVRLIIDFLHALTDTGSLDLRHDVPGSLASGLPVFD